MEDKHISLPYDRLSIVLAFITLAMGFIYFFPAAGNVPTGNFFGFILNLQFDVYTLLIAFLTLLALAGTIWVLQAYPITQGEKLAFWQLLPQCILPVMSVFVFSFALRGMERNNVWWVVYAMGSVLFGIILAAEFYAQEINTVHHPLTTIGLIGLSHALFLILAVVAKTIPLRIYVIFPLVFLTSGFTALRTIYLRLRGGWRLDYALAIALISGQIAIGLHYFFLNPVQYGLLLTGALYALISLACGFIQRLTRSDLILEPALMLGLTLIIVFIFT
jgi:hypothetical protein